MRLQVRQCLLSVAALLLAASSSRAAYTIDEVVIASAGGAMSGGAVTLDFTVGETAVGSGSSGSISMDCGYWEGVPIANVAVGDDELPVEFALRPSSPNPSTGGILISYTIPKGQDVPVFLGIYDVRGALIKTLVREPQGAGTYSVTWGGRSDSEDFPVAGVYFASLHAGAFQQIHKIVLLK